MSKHIKIPFKLLLFYEFNLKFLSIYLSLSLSLPFSLTLFFHVFSGAIFKYIIYKTKTKPKSYVKIQINVKI